MIKILVLSVIMNDTEFRGKKTYFLKFCLKYQVIKKYKDTKTDTKQVQQTVDKQ